MRAAVLLLLGAAVTLADVEYGPPAGIVNVETDVDEQYYEEPHDRTRRAVHFGNEKKISLPQTSFNPTYSRNMNQRDLYEVKRGNRVTRGGVNEHSYRGGRSRRETYGQSVPYQKSPQRKFRTKMMCECPAGGGRYPRYARYYEVREPIDEPAAAPAPSFRQMQATSAQHYHQLHAAPAAPEPAHYLNPQHISSAGAPAAPQPAHYFGPQEHFAAAPPAQAGAPQRARYLNSHVSEESASARGYANAPVQPETHAAANADASAVHNEEEIRLAAPINYEPFPSLGPVSLASEPRLSSPSVKYPEAMTGEATSPEQYSSKATDQDSAAAGAGHQHEHASHHTAGAGHKKHAGHHGTHGGKTVKGFKTSEHLDKGAKGFKTDEKHRKEYAEEGGKKKHHRDHADHRGAHEEEAHGHRGAHFDEKKGHKKGHKTKGYHNKYHKDEFHKEHKFYDDFHKSGEHHRYGKFHAKHASNEGGKKKAHHLDSGHDFVEKGKKGHSNKGHIDSNHKGYKGKHGHEEHHEKHEQHGKKGGGDGGKQWGYAKKN